VGYVMASGGVVVVVGQCDDDEMQANTRSGAAF
jgi:hypothetical protein